MESVALAANDAIGLLAVVFLFEWSSWCGALLFSEIDASEA